MPPVLDCPVSLKDIESLLRTMGASGRFVGLQYAVRSIALIIEDPERIRYIVKGVYSPVSQELGVSMSSVERGIRTMVAALWNQQDRTAFEQAMGYRIIHRPTNSEFLDALAHRLRDGC